MSKYILILENLHHGGEQSAIKINPKQSSKDHIQYKYSIKDNLIEIFVSSIPYPFFVDSIVIEGNKIETSNSHKLLYPKTPALNLVNCNDTSSIAGNTLKTDGDIKTKFKIDNESLFKINY